jgi:hypothetical protein
MVARVVTATDWDQREERTEDNYGVGQEASLPSNLTQTVGMKNPVERKQQ